MKRVILESPYAGDTAEDVERNLTYAREALRDSLLRGEAPIASHLLYTQKGVLDDRIREERALGIAAGLAWGVGSGDDRRICRPGDLLGDGDRHGAGRA